MSYDISKFRPVATWLPKGKIFQDLIYPETCSPHLVTQVTKLSSRFSNIFPHGRVQQRAAPSVQIGCLNWDGNCDVNNGKANLDRHARAMEPEREQALLPPQALVAHRELQRVGMYFTIYYFPMLLFKYVLCTNNDS